ncbi:MAG: polymorphic toxin-type HINT domain-containing protein, partial [Bacteroidales bacterium]|jgi:hypothetical protein|nr:polymorphic toxin-type HINT domain-containing protein [Bacteroidales bacterium]
LHKYLYANANPVNYIDPTGNFSLVSFEAANTIRGILAETTVQVGFSILDSAFSDGEDAGTNVIGAGLATIGGPAAFKLFGMLSSKFRKACNSFDSDTEVWTDDGIKLITDLNIGDEVWAFNEDSGELELQDIVHLIQREGEYQLIELIVGNEKIDTTDNHPFYVKIKDGWEWKDAGEIKIGDIVRDKQGNEKIITGLSIKPHTGKVYNLTVDNVHTYLVGEQGLVAHNAGKCDIPVTKTVKNALSSGMTKDKKLTTGGYQYVGKTGGYIQASAEFRKMITTFGYKKNSLMNRGDGAWTAQLTDGTYITLRKKSSPSISIDGDKYRYTKIK